jgi:glycogen operon protein
MLSGRHAPTPDSDIYVAMNMYWDALPFRVPQPNTADRWRVAINTSMRSPEDIFDPHQAPFVDSDTVIAGPRSIIVLIASTH